MIIACMALSVLDKFDCLDMMLLSTHWVKIFCSLNGLFGGRLVRTEYFCDDQWCVCVMWGVLNLIVNN